MSSNSDIQNSKNITINPCTIDVYHNNATWYIYSANLDTILKHLRMYTNLIVFLRIALSVLVFSFTFTANAYTSSGADGSFNPTTSVVIDLSQQIFNYTSIFIPSDVTVSFSGLSSLQPIELLAMGNIDIAGTLNLGTNSLWIETPNSIFLSGSILLGSGSDLTLVGSQMTLSGIINVPGGNLSITSGNGTSTDNGGTSSGGFTLCSGICPIQTSFPGGILIGNNGGGLIIGGALIPTCLNCSNLLSPVPEADTYAMLIAGLGLMGFMGHRRKNTLM